jgi:hypothetical protein
MAVGMTDSRHTAALPAAPGGLGTGTVVALGATVVAGVLDILAAANLYRVAGGYLDLVDLTQFPDRLDQAVAFRTAIRGLYWIIFLICAAIFLAWFRQARLAAQAGAPDRHRYAPGWALWAWFLPGAWWFLPRRIAADILGTDRRAPWGATVQDLWWTCWVGFSAVTLENAVVSRWTDPHKVPQLRGAAVVDLATTSLGVAAAITAMAFVRHVDPHRS